MGDFSNQMRALRDFFRPGLPADELAFCNEWMRRSDNATAATGMLLGLIFHTISLLIVPVIANDVNRSALFLVTGTFVSAHALWFAYLRQTRVDARTVLWVLSLAYVGCLAFFMSNRTFIDPTFTNDEIAVSLTTFFGISIFLILLSPFSKTWLVLLKGALFSILGTLAVAHMGFPEKWMTIEIMGVGFACYLQIAKNSYRWQEARREFNALQRIATAERDQMERAVQLAESESRLSREKYAAMTQTTQMLAHDIRKPFSMVKALTKMVQDVTDPQAISRIVNRFDAEVTKSIETVDRMVSDILAIADEPELTPKPTALETILEISLTEALHDKQSTDIAFSYDLTHRHLLDIDPTKVKRVVTNILDNALGAMKGRGSIWFSSREITVSGKAQVEICIGNNGAIIDPSTQQHLFEAFYSSGSENRLGMGLAIAKKFVEAHHGTIRCSSHREIGTRFWITLPLTSTLVETRPNLPQHSSQVTAAWFEFQKNTEAGATKERAHHVENAIIKSLGGNRAFQVLMVEDEHLYVETVAQQISNLIDSGAIRIDVATSSSEAMAYLDDNEPDLIICDIDLGPDSDDGFALVKNIRSRGVSSFIAIHSNRIIKSDSKKAIQAGADTCLPKPIGRVQMLRLIEAITQDQSKIAV